MNLLEHVKQIPRSIIRSKRRARWTKYRDAYAVLLLEKEKSPREAVRIISEFEGLSAPDAVRLYNAAKHWKVKSD